jgi:hypothetical protein
MFQLRKCEHAFAAGCLQAFVASLTSERGLHSQLTKDFPSFQGLVRTVPEKRIASVIAARLKSGRKRK